MGSNNSATNAANAANAARQSQINGTVQQIQNAYSSPARQAQYDTFGNQINKYLTGQVNEQEAQNARNLKFAEARSGLTGGSANVDANTQLQKDYTKGLLTASQQAQQGKASLQQADINSKNNLESLAESGAYLGSIPTQIAQSSQANLGAAQQYMNPQALGNLFAGTSGIYSTEQTAAANRKAQTSPIGSLYGTSGGGW